MSASQAIKQRYAHQVDTKEALEEGWVPQPGPRGQSPFDMGKEETSMFPESSINSQPVPKLQTQRVSTPASDDVPAEGVIEFSNVTQRTMTLSWRCQPALSSRDMRYKLARNGQVSRGDPHSLLVSTGGPYKPVAILDPRDGDGNTLSYTVTHLKAGRRYDFKVQVGNSNVRCEAVGTYTTPGGVYQAQ